MGVDLSLHPEMEREAINRVKDDGLISRVCLSRWLSNIGYDYVPHHLDVKFWAIDRDDLKTLDVYDEDGRCAVKFVGDD